MKFQTEFRHSNGNLHVKAVGGFDDDAAEHLLELFHLEYPAGGRIFVNTEGVGEVHSSGRETLGNGLPRSGVPASSVFFMGEKGFQMAPDGTRVLIFKHTERAAAHEQPHKGREGQHCCGNCARCSCRRKQHNDGSTPSVLHTDRQDKE